MNAETIFMLLALPLIGASVVVIAMVLPKIKQVREDWVRSQAEKKALQDAERAAQNARIAFAQMSAAFAELGTFYARAFAVLADGITRSLKGDQR